jgi:predicted dinucleotide-binding enzyme
VDIGIIGAGKIGGTVAGLLARAGHEIALSNSRGPETLEDLIRELGPQVRAMTAEEAAGFGEVVLVAIPLGGLRDLPVAALAGKVVIDAMNYYPDRDGRIDELEEGGLGSSELVAGHLRDARMVKALNTIHFRRLAEEGRPAGDPQRLAAPIAGDDREAKRLVAGLIDQIGFDAVDAGGLRDGRRQQPGTPVYNRPLTAEGVREALERA